MTGKQPKLPYRDTVGIMLIDRLGHIWVGRRIPKWRKNRTDHVWQMPQGGIEEGEDPVDTALREIEEEIGTSNIEVLGQIDDWLEYDLPEDLVGVALGGKYQGHRYKWFAMRFLGDDSEIDISSKDDYQPEFDDWRWIHIDNLEDLGLSFRRKVYRQVIEEFRHFVEACAAGDFQEKSYRSAS